MRLRRRPNRVCSFVPGIERLEGRDVPSGWSSYAHDPQHTAISPVAAQPLDAIRWQTPVDLDPQFNENDLLIHYGSPLVTAGNTVLVPVKTGATGGFEVRAFDGADGTPKWTQTTDYLLPPHDWTPSYGPALTPANRLYLPGTGGTVSYTDNPDAPGATTTGRFAFYGLSNYTANPDAFDGSVFINTPITSDAAGDIYFGFQVTGSNPLNLKGGIARIAPDGTATYASAATLANNTGITKVADNSAPALSNDGQTLYVAVNTGDGTSIHNTGYLLALDSTTLAVQARRRLKDPDGNDALLPDDGTASPTVGPDGDVYFGVLENPFPYYHDRGWLLHFTADLSQQKPPGAFGWDDTASIVPASAVPSYQGASAYLLMTKYNDYAGDGGTGHNEIAVLDPTATEVCPVTGNPNMLVMDEVLTILGPTPDPEFPTTPGAVREWCINTAAVDPATRSVLAGSEDGRLYRWDLTTNTFSQSITLTPGVGEAYTPTVVGPDGTVYAINDATLYAVGKFPTSTALAASPGSSTYGQTVTLTATVTAASGTPGGTVTFLDGTATLGTAPLNAAGVATFATSSLPAGTHTLTAVYGGAADFSGSTSPAAAQTVARAVLTVTADDKAKVAGDPLPLLTATITGFVNNDPPSVVSGSPALSVPPAAVTQAGTFPITAAVGSLAAANYTFTFVAGTLTVSPANPSSVVPTAGTPQTATVGLLFAVPFKVAVRDAYGNPVPGVTVTFAAPAGGPGGTFPGGAASATAVTDATGVATAPLFTANTVGGSYTLTATAPGPVGPAGFELTNTGPQVLDVVVNGGAAQRSRVTTLTVTFDTQVDAAALASAFTLTRASDGTAVGAITVSVSVVNGGTVVTLTFDGTGTEYGSLADGWWTLTIAHAQVLAAAGGLAMAADYTSARIGRLFGDTNGDGVVDITDYTAFRSALGQSSGQPGYDPALDDNADGVIDITDRNAFRSRLGSSLPP